MSNDKKFINLCPHPVRLTNGQVFSPSRQFETARVKTHYSDTEDELLVQADFEVKALPPQQHNTYYIVSSMCFNNSNRQDLVIPAVNDPDVHRLESGQVWAVKRFICKSGMLQE